MRFAGEPGTRECNRCPGEEVQKFTGEEHRDVMEASVRTSVRPDCRARGPGLPSSSSMRRVSGRRRAVRCRRRPPGVYALRKRMLSQGECERPVTADHLPMQNRQKTREIIGPRPQTGDLLGCRPLRATSGCAKKSALSLTNIQVAVNSPRSSLAGGRDGYGAAFQRTSPEARSAPPGQHAGLKYGKR